MNWQDIWDTLSPILSGLNITTLVALVIGVIKSVITIVGQSKEIKGLSNKFTFIETSVAEQKKERDEAFEENEMLRQSNAVMFKAISYLVSASKIPTEDKLDLLEDINNLKKPLAEALKTDVDTIEEPVKEGVVDIIEQAAQKTKTLIDKYVGEQ